MPKIYYFDSCMWLNLFKKEGDINKGIPYWKLASDFLEKIEEERDIIIVSTIVLKELQFKLGNKFNDVDRFFKEKEFIKIIKTTNEDYILARNFEQEHKMISFYDYLHVSIVKRLSIILITRDNMLKSLSQNT